MSDILRDIKAMVERNEHLDNQVTLLQERNTSLVLESRELKQRVRDLEEENCALRRLLGGVK